MIEPGSAAPEFTLPDQDGNTVSLSDYRGRTVVLVFYPADFSRVCTDQLSVYQEVLPQLEEAGAQLVGKRRRLLKYLQASDIDRYRALIQQLGLRR